MEEYIDFDGSKLTIYIINEDKFYYNSNGYLHRLDGPAIEWNNGNYSWWKDEKCHRLGGPAIYYYENYKWFINDKNINVYYIYG